LNIQYLGLTQLQLIIDFNNFLNNTYSGIEVDNVNYRINLIFVDAFYPKNSS